MKRVNKTNYHKLTEVYSNGEITIYETVTEEYIFCIDNEEQGLLFDSFEDCMDYLQTL